MLTLEKQKLRKKILAKLKNQKEDSRDRKSRLIKDRLFKTRVFQKAKRVMFYITFDGEVDTHEMIRQAQKKGKVIAAPVCSRNGAMRPCLMRDGGRLVRGCYGNLEPARRQPFPLEDLDVVIVPGVAFDRDGNRLGRGKGYYDRFLSGIPERTASIGLAYDFQVLPEIPRQSNDVAVDKVISA